MSAAVKKIAHKQIGHVAVYIKAAASPFTFTSCRRYKDKHLIIYIQHVKLIQMGCLPAVEGTQDCFVRAEQLAQVAAGMKRKELLALDRLHPLVAILTKALEVKEKLGPSLEGGRQLAAALLEKAINAHSEAGLSPYSYLLVSLAECLCKIGKNLMMRISIVT